MKDHIKREIMDAAHAAEYLQIAVQTLARWRAEGTGPVFVKVGGSVRYELADLNDFMDARRHQPTSASRRSAVA